MSQLKGIKLPKQNKGPVWDGPESNKKNGGITYSLLCKFLTCRERFRCLVVLGLKPEDSFQEKMEFGNMFHLCEETYAKRGDWEGALSKFSRSLCRKYKHEQDQVEKWYNICKVMFPIYVKHWNMNKHLTERTSIFPPEHVFDVPYKLPSGRNVRLRGKWDRVDKVILRDGKGPMYGAEIEDHKTKSEIDQGKICNQLTFDLQMLYYAVAYVGQPHDIPFHGIRYNVIKRPRQYQGKKETPQQFYDRLKGIVEESPGEFFARWSAEVKPHEIEHFQKVCLNPILESLCDWWEWIAPGGKAIDPDGSRWGALHWQHPFGVYNPFDKGGGTYLDNYLATGNERGLHRTDNLYPELTEEQ